MAWYMSEYQPIYQTFMAPLFKELIWINIFIQQGCNTFIKSDSKIFYNIAKGSSFVIYIQHEKKDFHKNIKLHNFCSVENNKKCSLSIK